MPLLASAKTRKQLNADKRARDAEKAFARDQAERRANHKIGGSKDPFAQAFFEVSEKARNKAIAHAMSKPSEGRDAQGLLVIKEAPKAIEKVKPSPWLPKLDSAKFQKLDIVDNKVVRTPVKKLNPLKKDVDSPKLVKDKLTKVEFTKSAKAQEIAKNKDKKSFEKKFEKASESEKDWSAFPDVDWAGFPSQSSHPGSS